MHQLWAQRDYSARIAGKGWFRQPCVLAVPFRRGEVADLACIGKNCLELRQKRCRFDSKTGL